MPYERMKLNGDDENEEERRKKDEPKVMLAIYFSFTNPYAIQMDNQRCSF
jgi:hypothetical protein